MTAAVAIRQAHDDAATGPQRRCLVTRAVQPRQSLVRFVVGPDGTVVPDVAGRLPGRGMWTVSRRDAVTTAVGKRLFARAARRPVQLTDDLADVVERQLARRCLDLLGLARRSGQVVIGFEEVRAWLRSWAARTGRGVLVTAADAATDGRAKLAALADKAAPGIERVDDLTAAELGSAWGRERIVHAALADGRLAARLVCEATRLAGLRGPAAAQ